MKKRTLRELRKNRSKTLEEVSDTIGIHVQTLSRYELLIGSPSRPIIDAILDFYELKYEDIDWDNI